jgi:hypothetical protein
MPATFSVLEIQLSPFLLATFSKKYLQKTIISKIKNLSSICKILPELFCHLQDEYFHAVKNELLLTP